MRIIINYFLYSNLFIALCAFCLTMSSSFIFRISKVDLLPYALFSFFSVFTYYNFQRIFQYKVENYKTDSNYSTWLKQNLNFKLVSIVLIVIFLLFFVSEVIICNWFWLLVSGIVAVFYFLPFFPIRKIVFVKPYFVSFFWVLICILFPLYHIANITVDELLIFSVAEFFFIAALCLLFDVRDMQYDEKAGVTTFPLKFGLFATKITASSLLVFYLILFFSLSHVGHYPRNNLIQYSSVIVFLFSLTLVWFTNKKRGEYYYSFLVDGCILLQFMVLLGIEYFQ